VKYIPICLCALIAGMLPLRLASAEAPTVATVDEQVIGLVQRAENLCDTGRPEEALPLLDEAVALKPEVADIYRVWGCAYDKEEQWPKAEEKYQKWAELAPHSYKPFQALGVAAFKQSHYVQSNDYFAQAKRLNPYRSFIIDSRCHNFVLLQQWPQAMAECTEAIALNPRDGYAYGERSKAERAAQDTDKADSDATAAHKYQGAFGDSRFTKIKIMFPIVFGLIAAAFLSIGLSVFLRKRPLILSSRWMFGLMLVCFSPQFALLPLTSGNLGDQHASLGFLMRFLVPLMFIVLLIFMWLQMQGYMLFGVVDKSFRKALLSVLDELHLERQEELSVIRIPSANLDIQVAIQSWVGAGQVRNKSKSGKEVFRQIIDGLKRRFAQGELQTNNITPVLYMVIGTMMLVFCFVLARL
jgi:Tfp pilus assembly protein PilF